MKEIYKKNLRQAPTKVCSSFQRSLEPENFIIGMIYSQQL